MFILSYYLFGALYTFLFAYLFQLNLTNLSNPWLYVLIIVSLLIGFVVSFITQLFIVWIVGIFRQNKGYKDSYNHRFANSLLKLALHIMRVKVVVSGKENIPDPSQKFILMGNHQENYDIIILKPIFTNHIVNFVAKEALTKMPIIGRWIDLLGNVFISREVDRSAAESIVKSIQNYKNGICMGIFPEGKRSFKNEMIRFRPGAFKLAMKPKADILIATQYNTCSIFKRIPWKKYRVYVHIHPLLTYKEYEGMKSQELAAHVKAIIQTQLDHFEEQLK
jgi:1-acyl-sn-glycerol-3-phosphate acyltransferase